MSRATAEKEVRLGELVRVPLAPRLIRQLSVVYPKERFHPRLVTAFVEFAKSGLAAMHRNQDRIRGRTARALEVEPDAGRTPFPQRPDAPDSLTSTLPPGSSDA
ncbi:MAG TPA: LysR substrate-binding domain-containing protein [Casimicrobiaceae bacterium]|nr:LysR substrate-binding domain-containing protein [Casimicrobiaceae bacterium]